MYVDAVRALPFLLSICSASYDSIILENLSALHIVIFSSVDDNTSSTPTHHPTTLLFELGEGDWATIPEHLPPRTIYVEASKEDEGEDESEDGTLSRKDRYRRCSSSVDFSSSFLLIRPPSFPSVSEFIMGSGYPYSQHLIFYILMDHSPGWTPPTLEILPHPHTAPIVRISQDGRSRSSVFSYLCKCWVDAEAEEQPHPPTSALLRLHRSLNWVGGGVVGFFKSQIIVDPALLPSSSSMMGDCEGYFDKEEKCLDMYVVWGILQRHLNFSIVQVGEYGADAELPSSSYPYPSLQICMDCFPHSSDEDDLIFYADVKKTYLIYCEYSKGLLQGPEWLFFLEPFDVGSWGILALLFLLLAVLLRSTSGALSLYLVLLNQSTPRDHPSHSHLQHFPLLLLGLTFLSLQYQGFMTTTVLAPPGRQVLQTAKEWFEAGFRFVLPDPSYLDFASNIAGGEVARLSSNVSAIFIFRSDLDQFNSLPEPGWFSTLAHIRGSVMAYAQTKRNIEEVGWDRLSYNASCSFVRESFKDIHHVWGVRAYLKERLWRALEGLQEGDILLYWYRRLERKIFLKTFMAKGGKGEEEEGEEGYRPLPLDSSIKIILFYYLGAGGAAVGMMVGELIRWQLSWK